MKESIAKNTLTIFITKLASWFFLFLAGILIARTFGPKGLGTYDLFMSIINLFVMLGSFGIGTASIYLLNRKKEDPAQLFSNVVMAGIVWGIALFMLVFLFFSHFSLLPSSFPRAYILFAAFAIPFVLLQNYLLPFFLAKFKIFYWSFFSIFSAVLIASGTFFLILILHQALASAVYFVLVSNALVFILLLFAVMRITSARFGFKKDLFLHELRVGLTSYVGDIFQGANFRLNLFFVSMFSTIAQVGYYSVALNIGNILFLVPYAFQQVLYSAWSLREEKEVERETPSIARQTLLVGVGVALLIFFIGKYVVVNMLYGRNFSPSVFPLALLLPGVVCMVFAGTFFNNFFSRGKAYITTLILLFVFLLNILLNIFFIPNFGMQGAAVGASISYGVAAFLALFLFSRMSGYSIRYILRFQASDVRSVADHLRQAVFGSPATFETVGKIRVCHVASADITLRFLVLAQLKYLQRSGFQVHTVSSPGKWVGDLKEAGIPHTTIRIVRKVFTPLSDIIALVQLFLLFKKEKFHIVHTHTLKASFLGQIAAFFAGVPVRVYTIHGLDFLNISFPPLARSAFKLADKMIARLVDLMFSVNKETLKIVQKEHIYPAHKVAYLGVGIDLERFNSSRFDSNDIVRKKNELGIPLSAKMVGMVSRLVKEKGYPELFEAFQEVLKKFPEAFLVVVGGVEPEKKDSFDQSIASEYGIEKNIVFLGERRDVDELDALFDVLVLPSYREGLGITLLEASAMKKPVIASDISGCREAVDNGKTGILVPPKNAEKLAQAIVYLFSNLQVAKAMGEAGRKKVEQEFDEKFVFERLKAQYERLLKEKCFKKA